ncbi:hypothetical protein KAH81_09765 [bacterium]|nr:hypothetical protein [bacterium]
MKKSVFLLIIFSVFAFDPGDYLTSEDDILEALSREEISYTQYYELLELMRDKVNLVCSDLTPLLVVPGVDERWVKAIEEARGNAGYYANRDVFIRWFPFDFERIEAFIYFEEEEKRSVHGNAKIYTHGKLIENDIPTTNGTIDIGTEIIKAECRFIDEESFSFRRRTLDVKYKNSALTLGSFSKGFGNGLILGKAFHVPGARRDNTNWSSLSTPVDNLFNGLRYEGLFGNIETGFVLSRVVYNSVIVDALGSKLCLSPTKLHKIGAIYSFGRVQNTLETAPVFTQGCASVFGNSVFDVTSLDYEIGFSESGNIGADISVVTKFENVRSLVAAWKYSDEFYPLHGNGESDYRKTNIELGESDVIMDSKQAGEEGAKLKLTAKIENKISLDFDQSAWRTVMTEDWGVASKAALQFRSDNGKRLRGELAWEKRTLSTGERLQKTVRFFGYWPLVPGLNASGYFRFRRSNLNEKTNDGISTNVEIFSNGFEPFEIRFLLKRTKTDINSDNSGYWALRLRSNFNSGPIIWLAEYRLAVYDKIDKDALSEFRLTCSYYWR